MVNVEKIKNAFHLLEFLFGVFLVLSAALQSWAFVILSIFYYEYLVILIQVLRKNGVIIYPIVIYILPKKLKKRIMENM